MIRESAVVLLSLVPVIIGLILAEVVWTISPMFDPLWRASFTVFTWVVGFAGGTKLFWNITQRFQRPGSSQ